MNTVLLSIADLSLGRELTRFLSIRRCGMTESNPEAFTDEEALSAQLFIVECSTDQARRQLGLIERFRLLNPLAAVIACAVHSSEDVAIAAFRLGVRDYFRCPAHQREFFNSIDRNLPRGGPGEGPLNKDNFTGQSRRVKAVTESIRRAASTESNVLITGETGTGKELVAQSLHRQSARAAKPLVSVNCAAIPDTLLESELFGYERGAFTGATATREGKLQLANGGTIFFDEVGDLNAHAQAKLLRAVETREVYPLGGRPAIAVDMRIIAATNQNLEGMVQRASFRPDLLFRLNVVRIDLPPLRERAADIPALLDYFVAHFNARWGPRIKAFDPECLSILSKYDWPGNVRELKNVVEAVYVNSRGGLLTKDDLPPAIHNLTTNPGQVEERVKLIEALFAMNWNVSRVAEKLQWSRMTVYRKLARYSIRRDAEPLPPGLLL